MVSVLGEFYDSEMCTLNLVDTQSGDKFARFRTLNYEVNFPAFFFRKFPEISHIFLHYLLHINNVP